MIYKNFKIIHCIYIIYTYNTHILFKDMLFSFFKFIFKHFKNYYPFFDLDIFDFYENLQNTVEITSNRSWCK